MGDLQHERLTALAAELRLAALPNLYGAVAQNFAQRQDVSYADFLEAILRAERDARRVRVREMLTRTAGFPALKTLDAYDFAFATGAPADPGTGDAWFCRADGERRAAWAERNRENSSGHRVRITGDKPRLESALHHRG